jgi:hypothetical protein
MSPHPHSSGRTPPGPPRRPTYAPYPPQPSREEANQRTPRGTASPNRIPARTTPIGLDLFYDWSRP